MDRRLGKRWQALLFSDRRPSAPQRRRCARREGARMTARIIDGKAIAAELRGKAADAAHRLARDRSLVPGLAVILVGSNPASEVYVGSKTKAAVGSGMRSYDHRLPE